MFFQNQKLICLLTAFILFVIPYSAVAQDNQLSFKDDPAYQQYMDFFEEIYDTVVKNYYQKLDRAKFEQFIQMFDQKIYSQLKESGKTVDFIRWRSAAFLVEHLRTSEDIFSAFYPPKPAKEFEETALGVKYDLGITGQLEKQGFKVTSLERRSEAYQKGLRTGDVLLKINEQSVKKLSQEKVDALLNPLENEKTALLFLSSINNKKQSISVISKEYYKQTVSEIKTLQPHIYGLKIERFNRKTSDDLFLMLTEFQKRANIQGLIIDLRDNPGGPPLAAREIAAFFLPGEEEFAYFSSKDEKIASLNVPKIPHQFKFDAPIVILVNQKSGSASELFSGILQRKQRAVLMGENSAGQVMLKSMFHFDDESMVLLITARGHHPDGAIFKFTGLVPDKFEKDIGTGESLIDFATKYLIYSDLHTG